MRINPIKTNKDLLRKAADSTWIFEILVELFDVNIDKLKEEMSNFLLKSTEGKKVNNPAVFIKGRVIFALPRVHGNNLGEFINLTQDENIQFMQLFIEKKKIESECKFIETYLNKVSNANSIEEIKKYIPEYFYSKLENKDISLNHSVNNINISAETKSHALTIMKQRLMYNLLVK